MGDSGALLLGYMINLFVFSFCEMNASHSFPPRFFINAAPALAISLLIVPLFDTVRVMVTRMKNGHSPFNADKNHVHHLLLGLGLKHRDVSFILMGITLGFLILGIILRNLSNGMLVSLDFIICLLLTKYLWTLVDRNNIQNKKNRVTKKKPAEFNKKP